MRVIKYGTRLDEDRIPCLVKEMSRNYSGRSADAPDEVLGILRDIEGAENLVQEKLWMFCLNAKLKIIGYFELFAGGKQRCYIDTSIMFTSALATGASSIIVAHNHPSGDPTPSQEDMDLTSNIISGARLLGMKLEDHIIIGDKSWASLREMSPDMF